MSYYQDTIHQDFTNENELKMTDEIFLENFSIAVAAFDVRTTESVDLTDAFEWKFNWLDADLS